MKLLTAQQKIRLLRKYPPLKIMAVDIDDTLVVGKALNQTLMRWVRAQRRKGFLVYLWSMRGEAYSRRVAQHYGIVEDFDVIIGKPHVIVDDQGWSWVQMTKQVRSEEILTD